MSHTFQYTVVSTGSVTLRPEGTNDKTNWFPLSDSLTDTVIPTGGVYMDHKATTALFGVRVRVVSKTATTANVTAVYMGSKY